MDKYKFIEDIEFLIEEFEEGHISPYKLVVKLREIINKAKL